MVAAENRSDTYPRHVATCGMTRLHPDRDQLRHCIRPAGHHQPDWPWPDDHRCTDGETEWY